MERWASIAAVLLLAGCVSVAPADDSAAADAVAAAPAPALKARPPPPGVDTSAARAYLPPGLLEAIYLGGAGQALILRWPDAVTVIGTTGDAASDSEIAGTSDPLAGTLRDLGIRHVDSLVILGTGPWREGGCTALFEAVSVGRLYHPGTSRAPSTEHPCLESASAAGTAVLTARELDAGDLIPLSAHATATVIAPNASPGLDGVGQFVLKIQHGSVSLLAAGDLGCAGEAQVLEAGLDLDVDLLLQGFPGGSDGGCSAWISATSPEVVLAADDRRIAPSANVEAGLAAAGALVVRPGAEGHLVDSDGWAWRVRALVREAEPTPDAPKRDRNATSASAQVRITRIIHEDVANTPEGFNEWVELRNFGRLGADLTGWSLRHPDGAIFHFPAGTRAGPDVLIRVHTGNCIPEETELCWGRREEVWKGEGFAMLFDQTVMIDRYDYGQT